MQKLVKIYVYGTFWHFESYNVILTKLNQHVNEMVTMAGKKFQNFGVVFIGSCYNIQTD